jgi:2-aminoadipate transaminase
MVTRFARRMEGVRPNAIGELLKHGADPSVISFAGGYPDPGLFPVEELRLVFHQLLTEDQHDVLQYTVSDGLPSLRAHVAARMMRDGVDCTAEDVLILQGGQQGLDLVGKMVLDPGDTVITEDPTFLGGLIAFAPNEPTYAPVLTDDDGMDTDHLARVLARSPRARLLYTVPDFQNPTGVTLSLERRHRLIELANQFDLVVLEDTPYRHLRYDGLTLPTLKSLDTQGRVVFVGSFSKIMTPGMRLGWAVASGKLRDGLGLLKLAADTQCSTLNMAAASAYMDQFDLDGHIAVVIAAYRQKRDLMLRMLGEAMPASVRFTHPTGGLFTWLTFPDGFDAADFMRDEALPKAKVAYVPGGTFYPVVQQPNHARFNFSFASEDMIVTGISRLGELLRATLGA